MTEQEIVNILKENKYKGVAFLFLPGEVSNWITDNLNNSNLLYLDSMGDWQYFKDADFDDYDNVVFALPEMYELPVAKVKGEWVEFEIDQKGNFHCFKDNDMHYFFWANWNIFLKAFSDEYTSFGGWQYENISDSWNTFPLIRCGEKASCGVSFSNDDKPMIPKKIRFWREAK